MIKFYENGNAVLLLLVLLIIYSLCVSLILQNIVEKQQILNMIKYEIPIH
mgnify:CR=1 FL=1